MTLEFPNAETAMGYCFSSFGISSFLRHSFEHVAPTELESLIDGEAIDIALLMELQLMEDWDFIEHVTDETNCVRWRMRRGSR
jgi:hypothetical protein